MKFKNIFYSLLILLGCAFSNSAQAQNAKMEINFGPEALFPLGETAGLNDFSYAGSLQLVYHYKPKIHFTATAAYAVVKPAKSFKDLWEPWGYTFEDAVFMPVKAGIRYNLTERVFIAADAGASIPIDSLRSTSFAYSGSIGTNIPLGKSSSLHVSAKYENWALNINRYSNFIGLRVAYALPLFKN